MNCVSMLLYVYEHDLNRKVTVFWWGKFQKRSQRRTESNICVDLHMCGICLWSLSAGPLPGVAAHTVKSYERCESPRGYHHFNNAWITQSKSIAIDLLGAAKWSRGRRKWCNSTLKTILWERPKSWSLLLSERKIYYCPESLNPLNFSPFIFQKWVEFG